MDIKVAKVEDSYIVEMLKFTDFIFIFSLLLPNFAKIIVYILSIDLFPI